jgi:hypothetical protein
MLSQPDEALDEAVTDRVLSCDWYCGSIWANECHANAVDARRG